MTHTPGPWEVERTYDGHEIRMGTALEPDHSGYLVQHIIEYEHGLFERYNDGTPVNEVELRQLREADANARLIAAAPELFEALVVARTQLGLLQGGTTDTVFRFVVELIDEAIAKAKGENDE